MQPRTRYAAVLLLVVAACGDSGSGLPAGPTTTLDAFESNFVTAAVADAGSGGLNDDEAECLALAILDDFSRQRLVEVGISPDGAEGSFLDGGTALTPAERSAIVEDFNTCLADPFEWLFPVRTNDDQCMLDFVRDGGVTLEQLLFAEIPEFGEVVGQTLVDAAASCSS